MGLENKLIVLTRTDAGNRAWTAHLARRGAKTYSFPAIGASKSPLTPELEQALCRLAQFDWLILPSATGVRFAVATLAELGIDLTHWPVPRIAVIGKQSAATAHQAGLMVSLRPSQANSTALANELPDVTGRHILTLRSDIAPGGLVTTLRRRGADVTDLTVYQTHLRTEPDPIFSHLLKENEVRFLVFASPSAVRGFIRRLTTSELKLAKNLSSISIGPSVTATLQQSGFSQVHQAAQPSIESVHQTLLQLTS